MLGPGTRTVSIKKHHSSLCLQKSGLPNLRIQYSRGLRTCRTRSRCPGEDEWGERKPAGGRRTEAVHGLIHLAGTRENSVMRKQLPKGFL